MLGWCSGLASSMNISSTQPASMNLKSLKTTSGAIKFPATSSNRSELPSTATSSPSPTGRRSVSSMKGLMALALSPSLSSSCGNRRTLKDGDMDQAHDYLPERLARDLEMSADTFASEDMAAGARSTGLLLDEKLQARASRMLPYSTYPAASARVQNLGAIEEREPKVSSLNRHDSALVCHHSDSASMTSHDSSEEAEPPSFRHRGSVVTTATSVGSIHCKRPISPMPERKGEYGWVALDLDQEEREVEMHDDRNPGSPSLWPPEPRGPELAVMTGAPPANVPRIGSKLPNMLHCKSHSVKKDLSLPASPSHSVGPSPKPLQRSSSHASSRTQPQPQPSMSCAGSRTTQSSDTRQHRSSNKLERGRSLGIITANASATSHAQNVAPEPGLVRRPSRGSGGTIDSGEEVIYLSMKQGANKRNPMFDPRPPPMQPLRTVQSWLNNSLQPYPWASNSEANARMVPLPPDVVENLRVSVACFPETMLLTSSLTVETVRSYAKKVRHMSMDAPGLVTKELPLPKAPQRSLWRTAVMSKRGSQPSEPGTPPRKCSSRQGRGPSGIPSPKTDGPKPWTPLKNVFGCCSDYVCDALYAHIVAYNYVSALVARSPVPVSAHERPNTMSSRKSQQESDVPKKAASLLGLSVGGDIAASMGRISKRLGSPLADWTRDGMAMQRDRGPTAQENALRLIQSGLLRCVSRLVTTAKLMTTYDGGEEKIVHMEAEDADMLLMRSLCEIVRMAEDSADIPL